ncbi:PAS domain-containing hybrid sensor histidine kinase/response regulator [Cesiribacter andamanensis]|uniref:histidine kinase n=1 Tax=Cesiribacter andamanensis AMV16 TaxID=1279009 RepID=M7N4A7_9BACT|nr:PAS domain-containing protein [Cesiribacter andamanensis]EMR03508.1 Aerobic respiration control sensor protein ArcB [Cesiribacter andamanensis AMV16]
MTDLEQLTHALEQEQQARREAERLAAQTAAELARVQQALQQEMAEQARENSVLREDISAHEQIEERLRKSEEALLEAQELGNLGRWELSMADLSLQWSPQLFRQFGLDPQASPPAGGDFFSYIHPDDLCLAQEGIQQSLSQGYSSFELRIVRPDGAIRHLHTTVKVENGASGEPERVFGTSLDVTELRRTEDQLQKSEERFTLAMHGMNEGIWDWNLLTNEVYLSPQWKALIGYQDHELENTFENFTAPAHPEDKQRIKTLVWGSVASQPTNLSYECRMKHRTGQWRHVMVRCRLVYNQQGELIRLVGASSDVTQRVQAEQKLFSTIDQLKILNKISLSFNSVSEDFEKPIQEALQLIGQHIEASRVYIFENSSDGVFTSNTFEWCNTGISPQIDYLQNIPYSVLPHFRKQLKKEGLVYPNAEELPQALKTHLLKQSSRSLIIMPLYLQDELAGFVGLDDCLQQRQWEATDIDLLDTFSNLLGNIFERQQAEYRLLQSEEKYRSLVDNLSEVIFQTDENNCLIFLNPAWQEITGYSPEECLGQPLSSYILAQDRAEFVALRQLLHEHKIDFCRQVLRIRVKGGGVRYLEFFARLIENKWGQAVGLSGTLADVTDQQLTNEKLIKARDGAEKASQAKAQFLSIMSHEIRTPLNAMLGISQLLIRQKPRPDQEDNLRLLIFSGENLLSLINDILDFNKIEAGKIALEQTAFDLHKLCHGLQKALSLKADERNISLQLQIEEGVPARVTGDATRLTQILNNLLDNAIKFTPKGTVTLRVQLQELQEQEVQLAFSVSDTGIGIPADSLEQIFDTFTQAHPSSSTKYGGTGLGLAIVKRLLELLGSQITVESQQGEGSTFYFALRFALPAAEEAMEIPYLAFKEPPSQRIQQASLLLVEDNPLNMLVLVQFFEAWGVTPDVADNGLQALEKLQKQHYDLVLMDLHMPELDGMQTVKRIRKDLALADLPVIALTANARPGIRQQVIDAGMTDYISKPFEPEDLYRKVLKYLPQAKAPLAPPPLPLPLPQPAETAAVRFSLNKLYRQSNNNQEFVDRMVRLFIKTCEEQRIAFKDALQQGDAPRVRDIAHRLKPNIDLFEVRCQHSSIRRLELMELSELQTPEGWSMAEGLVHCLEEITGQLQKWVDEQSPTPSVS